MKKQLCQFILFHHCCSLWTGEQLYCNSIGIEVWDEHKIKKTLTLRLSTNCSINANKEAANTEIWLLCLSPECPELSQTFTQGIFNQANANVSNEMMVSSWQPGGKKLPMINRVVTTWLLSFKLTCKGHVKKCKAVYRPSWIKVSHQTAVNRSGNGE